MKLYLTHATSYNYESQLYEPLKQSLTKQHHIFFPHDKGSEGVKSKELIKECDLVLAEVSRPSTGQGIELGWADSFGVPIVCFYQTGSKPSGSLKFICKTFFEYSSSDDMTTKLAEQLLPMSRRV